MTGNRQAHPLLMTSANIRMNCRMKASFHACLLLALVPIPKFIERDVEIRGVLESRTFHAVLDFVLGPLKKVAEIGLMMSDPLGWHCFCFTPLVAYILDTPESAMLHQLECHTDPWDLGPYVNKAKLLRLNGVHQSFWHDWPMAEPSLFLTPEILHHWFKFAYDHIVKWCIAVLGATKIYFRFSVLPPHTGMRHLREGISKAKQVTGREHRDILRVRIQTRSYHDSQQLLEPETVKEALPKGVWKLGRGDPVLVNIDDDYHWPRSGLAGHAICQLKIIFCVVPRSGFVAPAGTDQFLAYVQRFDIVSRPNPERGANGPFPESSTQGGKVR
ncbi:hypothetical protein B0H16DRAFT_1455132 [Mycena metata]|uniref:DUF6830 domain-containing protein n=1 Tax=Mycena metata TaxID=1033252 RepID=A0AAD7JI52_9AGAR|nr:hypothetical protein B0H16DRAFT_1455132 [Mycena metata]